VNTNHQKEWTSTTFSARSSIVILWFC